MVLGVISLRFLYLLLFFAVCVLIYLLYRKIRDHVEDGVSYGVNNLREDAKIVDIKTEIQNRKDPTFVTRVKFDDGFVFISPCCDVEKHNMYNRLTLTPDMEKSIINGARLAHSKAMGVSTKDLEYELSSFKYKCGKCGRRGPYDDNCPECGSSFKVSDN